LAAAGGRRENTPTSRKRQERTLRSFQKIRRSVSVELRGHNTQPFEQVRHYPRNCCPGCVAAHNRALGRGLYADLGALDRNLLGNLRFEINRAAPRVD
jgi:hypothetical protein